jgi:hypothetical protein
MTRTAWSRHRVTGSGQGGIVKFLSRASIPVVALAGLLVVQAAPASVAATKPVPALCASTGPILARSAPAKISLHSCPIQGRLLAIKLRNGHLAAGLRIPPPGFGTGSAELTKRGEYELSAANTGGYLRIRWYVPARSRTTAPAADPACNENNYNLEGPFWANEVKPTDVWYYNQSTVSRTNLTVSATLADIRQANTNLTQGINNCGFTQGSGTFDVQGAYSGNTSKFANINSAAQCTSNFPDGQNTVSWGTFDSNHSSTLALTCYEWHTNANGYPVMTEADTYLGSNRNIVDSFPANCSNRYDLQSIMTHEWGHAYGLAHETGGVDEVMYPTKFSCNNRRHLGSGDYTAMAVLYP